MSDGSVRPLPHCKKDLCKKTDVVLFDKSHERHPANKIWRDRVHELHKENVRTSGAASLLYSDSASQMIDELLKQFRFLRCEKGVYSWISEEDVEKKVKEQLKYKPKATKAAANINPSDTVLNMIKNPPPSPAAPQPNNIIRETQQAAEPYSMTDEGTAWYSLFPDIPKSKKSRKKAKELEVSQSKAHRVLIQNKLRVGTFTVRPRRSKAVSIQKESFTDRARSVACFLIVRADKDDFDSYDWLYDCSDGKFKTHPTGQFEDGVNVYPAKELKEFESFGALLYFFAGRIEFPSSPSRTAEFQFVPHDLHDNDLQMIMRDAAEHATEKRRAKDYEYAMAAQQSKRSRSLNEIPEPNELDELAQILFNEDLENP